jgi:NADH-quinone oxidoreductase subunit C
MTARTEILAARVNDLLGERVVGVVDALGEVTVTLKAEGMVESMLVLRDAPDLMFEQVIDVCGLDYKTYGDGRWDGARYAVVYHLLSVSKNRRLRVRVFAPDDDMPMVDTVVGVWSAANWFEREAFDLFGILFNGHPDLRRILTDYGFIGHPFRKDFPISGHVEMRYDPDQRRVIYQPVTIDPREITPRIVREENYAGGAGFRKG